MHLNPSLYSRLNRTVLFHRVFWWERAFTIEIPKNLLKLYLIWELEFFLKLNNWKRGLVKILETQFKKADLVQRTTCCLKKCVYNAAIEPTEEWASAESLLVLLERSSCKTTTSYCRRRETAVLPINHSHNQTHVCETVAQQTVKPRFSVFKDHCELFKATLMDQYQ